MCVCVCVCVCVFVCVCVCVYVYVYVYVYVNNRRGDNNFIIAIKRTNSAVIATLQQSHEGLPKSIFLSQSSVESRD